MGTNDGYTHLIATVAFFHIALITVSAETREPDYDPAIDRPASVGLIPEDAWTAPIEGLRAAISAPAGVRFFETFQMYIVVSNVSKQPIKVTFPAEAMHPTLTVAGRPAATGGYANHRLHRRWEIAPGHEIAVPFPPQTIVRRDGFAPRHAIRSALGNDDGRVDPGLHQIACRFGTDSEYYEEIPGAKRRRIVPYPDDEWQGTFNLRAREIEVLDEEVELEVLAPDVLGTEHGLQPVFERQELGLPGGAFVLDGRFSFFPDPKSEAHWLVDTSGYTRAVHWGPFSSKVLWQSNILSIIKQSIRSDLAHDYDHQNGMTEMYRLTNYGKPLLELVFDLAPDLGKPKQGVDNHYWREEIARRLRDRRMELNSMGLAKKAKTALEFIAAGEPPLPQEDRFELVSASAIPADAPSDGWGPENDGLQAAAVLPREIVFGEMIEVALFVRNVSGKPLFMTVSKDEGFDDVFALTESGTPLEVTQLFDYSTANHFSSKTMGIRMRDPGVSPTVFYEDTILDKLKLEPSAIWKLKTRTPILFRQAGAEQKQAQSGEVAIQKDSISQATVTASPGLIQLTWELHTANGREYQKGRRRLHWPAKGGWTGILTTAPMSVVLKAP